MIRTVPDNAVSRPAAASARRVSDERGRDSENPPDLGLKYYSNQFLLNSKHLKVQFIDACKVLAVTRAQSKAIFNC